MVFVTTESSHMRLACTSTKAKGPPGPGAAREIDMFAVSDICFCVLGNRRTRPEGHHLKTAPFALTDCATTSLTTLAQVVPLQGLT